MAGNECIVWTKNNCGSNAIVTDTTTTIKECLLSQIQPSIMPLVTIIIKNHYHNAEAADCLMKTNLTTHKPYSVNLSLAAVSRP